jgi:quercetin dioxygenase-like cupin family protein
MKNTTYDFHGTKMTIKVLTSETNYLYSIMHFIHPPNVGPALHIHPKGPESFHIIKGDYKFFLRNEIINAKIGDTVIVPNGTPHKFNAGNNGGDFYEVSQKLIKGDISWDVESTIAQKYGQIFLENTNHWKKV